jgi:hypothetical protein
MPVFYSNRAESLPSLTIQSKLCQSMSPNLGLSASILDLRSQRKGKKGIVVGDILICYEELYQLLDTIDWSPSNQIMIPAGDLIDRRPKINEALIFAMTTPSVYSLMSNHEQKL